MPLRPGAGLPATRLRTGPHISYCAPVTPRIPALCAGLLMAGIARAEDAPGKHAPDWALWLGARAGAMAFGNSFYGGDTTGNFAQAGATLEADAGARLAKRHIPYVFYEEGLFVPGRKLDGTGATVTTRLFGVGFRYVALDPDTIGFVADVSFGWRTLSIYQGSRNYELSGFETFRLGLGAEVRLATAATLSALGYVSGGVMTDVGGSLTFTDGRAPPYTSGASITDQRGYLVVGVGLAAHFDLLGK